MANKKIFILLPDGIGLRNFAFTDFPSVAADSGFDIVFWNNTPFDLTPLGLTEVKIHKANPNPVTDLLKRAKIRSDLAYNISKTGDPVYTHYRFPLPFSNLKNAFKSAVVSLIGTLANTNRRRSQLRRAMQECERKTNYYAQCLSTLKNEKPDLVFCTNQRPVTAIAPMTAARDLGIPTAAFLFSWDNLPKGTMVVDADYYFVWSSHMKGELLFYYPHIDARRVFITGTPQYETHSDRSLIMPRAIFCEKYGLDPEKKYICYSGDDITTSPNDPVYLGDVADAVRQLNLKNANIAIIFRRCPVDHSTRFDAILEKNSDIITAIDPQWRKFGSRWDMILPTSEDLVLQMNTIAHTELVINLGSSMVFDFVAFEKPCAFINYNVDNSANRGWSVEKIYSFVHFRSMPDKKAVVWLNSRGEIAAAIESMLSNAGENVTEAKKWFEKINIHPANLASKRIVDGFLSILSNH